MPLQLSMETVIACSPMLGHKLEDRSRIRDAQDPELVEAFLQAGRVPLRHAGQRDSFIVAPLDILVEEHRGQNRFHIIETNGTGIGGLTNLPIPVIETILESLTEVGRTLPEANGLVLVASSGIESSKHPRHNHTLHEKMLYMEHLKRGFESRGLKPQLLTMVQVLESAELLKSDRPMIVLGYIKEFLNHLGCRSDGLLTLFGRPVAAAINDRFCLNIVSRFGYRVDMSRVRTYNRCFTAGGDKGVAYRLLDEYAQAHPNPLFPDRIGFDRAESRAELLAKVVDGVRAGRKIVIKPQGTGLGHGLEFFLDPGEAVDAIVDRVDHSIKVTEHYYAAVGGSFPYTLCDFFDARTIDSPAHELHGHKYELRVVVYRNGDSLTALPSIAKISSQGYVANSASRLSLINNITTSAEAKKREGTEFMQPLCHRETLELLGISIEEMKSLTAYCADYMRFILDKLEDDSA